MDADRKGVAKESLAVDIIVHSLGAKDGVLPRVMNGSKKGDFWSSASFDLLALEQGVAPVDDFQKWLASIPEVEGADELAEQVESARRDRRTEERKGE